MRNCGVFNTDIYLSQKNGRLKPDHPKELSVIAIGYNSTPVEGQQN
jgi:hypothetical protein